MVTQMHWECVPGCGQSKVESALHCGGQAEYLHDLTHNRCSAVIAAILVILIWMLFNVEKQSWSYLRMYILIPKQSIVSIITHILIFQYINLSSAIFEIAIGSREFPP